MWITILAGVVNALSAGLGGWLSMNPPEKQHRWRYMVAFGALGVLGTIAIGWQAVQQQKSEARLTRAINESNSGISDLKQIAKQPVPIEVKIPPIQIISPTVPPPRLREPITANRTPPPTHKLGLALEPPSSSNGVARLRIRNVSADRFGPSIGVTISARMWSAPLKTFIEIPNPLSMGPVRLEFQGELFPDYEWQYDIMQFQSDGGVRVGRLSTDFTENRPPGVGPELRPFGLSSDGEIWLDRIGIWRIQISATSSNGSVIDEAAFCVSVREIDFQRNAKNVAAPQLLPSCPEGQ